MELQMRTINLMKKRFIVKFLKFSNNNIKSNLRMNEVKITIVTPSYNRAHTLTRVYDSLKNQTFKDFKWIIMDDGSTDGTQEWLNAQKDIIVITQQNLGGAGGFFTGMKYVAEHDYDYCWIMDDDVVCQTDALQELVN